MRRGVATIALILALMRIDTAAFGQSRQELPGLPALFKADSVRHDRELGVVVATGNVEITKGERTLLADTVIYNQRTDVVKATGNVSLTEPSGDVMFAEYVELSGDLKDGIVRTIRLRLTDGSRIAAVSGKRTGGIRTEMRKAVYSPCKPCEDHPEATPIWQVKAFKVVHDKARRDIEYNDAFLEFFGIPVAYTPYLSHPDPTVKRRTGILIPTYGSDSELGVILRVPYYFNISPVSDATLTPILTGNEGVVLSGQYRRRFVGGEFLNDVSITRASRENGTTGLRGHVDGFTRFDINDSWRGGANIAYASDDTYLRRYGFSSRDTLTSRIFSEYFEGRNYGAANFYHFQGLRVNDDSGQTPIIHPLLDYNYVSEPGRLGGRWSVDSNLLALTRTEGTDSRRISVKTGWQVPYTSPIGELYTVFASLQTDGYWVDEVEKPDGSGLTASGLAGRAFPQIGLDWRLPMARTGSRFSLLAEPILGIVAAPNGGNPDLAPNEDSIDFELDDTNVFNANRFTGIDRVEGGQRIYYGLKTAIYGKSGSSSSVFVGQSYRIRKDSTFAPGSGLEDKFSDIIGRAKISQGSYFDLLYRFRLDKDKLTPRRNELSATLGPAAFRLSTTYTFVDQGESDEFPDREELSTAVNSRLSKRWSVAINTRRDLSANGGSLNHGAGITYQDDCVKFTGSFSRSFTRDRDVRPSDTFLFRIELKTLGTVRAAAKP